MNDYPLKNIKNKEKSFDLLDKSLTQKSFTLTPAEYFNDIATEIERVYKESDYIVCYKNNKRLYYAETGFEEYFESLEYNAMFNSYPQLNYVTGNYGYTALLFSKGSTSVLLNRFHEKSRHPVHGAYLTQAGNRLFMIDDEYWAVTDGLDKEMFRISFRTKIYVETRMYSRGKVTGAYEIGGRAYGFFENAIYTLVNTKSIENVKILRVDTPVLSIKQGTLAKIGNKVYFVNGNKLSYFDGENVKTLSSELDNLVGFTYERVGSYEHIYLLNLAKGVHRFTFAYDTQSGESYILPYYKVLSDRTGFVFNPKTNQICELRCEIKQNNLANFSESFTSNLGKNCIKCLTSFKIESEGRATLSISGDFGVAEYALTNGTTEQKFSYPSNNFTFNISPIDQDFVIKSASVKFKET